MIKSADLCDRQIWKKIKMKMTSKHGTNPGADVGEHSSAQGVPEKSLGIEVGVTRSPNMTLYQLFHARLVFVSPARHWHGTLPWTIWEIAKHLK
jgi:hypothetical protein